MKNYILIAALGLTISSSVFAAQVDIWNAKSIDKQFESQSEVIYKSNVEQSSLNSSESAKPLSSQQTAMAKTLSSRPIAHSTHSTFWIYDAWVAFHADEDGDGYANHFSVEFDADTEFNQARVYARLYLGKDDVFKEYHTTRTFSIFADSSDDSFIVESELLTGFVSADYEVLIELYDDNSQELVAVFDGYNDADLYIVSLESEDYEEVYVEPQVIIVSEYGGSVSWLVILLLPLALIRKYWLGQCA